MRLVYHSETMHSRVAGAAVGDVAVLAASCQGSNELSAANKRPEAEQAHGAAQPFIRDHTCSLPKR